MPAAKGVLVRVGVVPGIALAVFAALPLTALATSPPPISSISEYVETFPTSTGGTVKQPGATHHPGKTSPTVVQHAGADSAELGALVESAPPAARRHVVKTPAVARPRMRERSTPSSPPPRPIAAARVDVPSAGSALGGIPRSLGGTGIALVLALAAATAAVGLRRRRSR